MQNSLKFFRQCPPFASRMVSGLVLAAMLAGCQPLLRSSQVATAPEATPVPVENNWQKLYLNAQELLDSGQSGMAIKLLKLSADNNNISAHYALSELYRRNIVPIESADIDAQSLRLFHLRFAAEGGLPKAQATLAELYATGVGVRKSPELAMQYYTGASKAGIPEAQYGLGRIHADSSGAFYNPTEAARLWNLASEQGHQAAKADLGWLFYRGEGVAQSSETAVTLWQEASRNGIVAADWGLGRYMSEREKADDTVAAYYLQRAVDGGIPEAAYHLAEMYRTGKGVVASTQTARELYQKASTNTPNAAAAHFWLGAFALRGQGGGKDLPLARQNLQAAYDFGINQALPLLVETTLQQGKRPQKLLRSYFSELNADNPEALHGLLDLAKRYSLNLAEYGLSQRKLESLNTMIAEKGDKTMQRTLAQQAQENGDVAEQERWLRTLADDLDTVAMVQLSELQASRNPEESLMIDQRLAAQSHPKGLFRMGRRLIFGDRVAEDAQAGIALLLEAAKSGHIEAAFLAADQLARSDSDREQVIRLYQQASKGGHAEATLRLANLTTDQERRQALLLKAIDQGSEQAALTYAEGRYLHPKISGATLREFYIKAQNLPLAQLRLVLHDLYFGDETQAKNAVSLLEQFGKDEDLFIRRIALQHLGHLYTTGYSTIDLTANQRTAARYLDMLAEIIPHEAEFLRGNLAVQFNSPKNAARHWQAANTPEATFALGMQETNPEQQKQILGNAVVNGMTEAWLKMGYPLPMTSPEPTRSVREDQYRRGAAWTVWDYAIDAEYGITGKALPAAAVQWYRVAARLGMPKAFTALGRLLAETDPAESELWLRKAIAFDQDAARVVLGKILAQTDPTSARKLWQQAARAGNDDAELYLAYAYDSGIGGKQDPKKAFALYRKLFQQGHKQAGFSLANMYLAGRGTKANLSKSLEILETAGNQGDPRAWLQLGKVLSDPQYPDIYDPEKAAGFLLLAAHSHQAEAWHTLGTLYDEQGALPHNPTLAYDYYQNAAHLGWPDAQYQLGLGYHHGRGGLPADPLRAYAWLELASAQGDIAASMVRDSITVEFKDGDLDKVKAILAELKQRIKTQ